MDTVQERIKRVLIYSLFLEGIEPSEIEDDASLRDEMGLDSVDALELVLGLEKEFQIKILGKGIERDSFETVNTLAAFVNTRLAAPEARS